MPLSRLRTRAEFLRARAKGRKTALPGLVLQLYRREDGMDETRVGFTVTKKVGNAVVRNRARRRLREVARLALGDTPPPGLDLVLIGRDGTLGRRFDDLLHDFRTALDRIGPQARGRGARPAAGGAPGGSEAG